MPLVPLQSQQQQPSFLDTGIRTLRTPQLPSAGNEWGQALGQAANLMGQLQTKMAEANDTRHLIEAEGEMRSALASQLQFQQTNIEEKDWLPRWQKTTATLTEDFAKRDLSESGRLRLTQSFGRFSDNQSLEIQGQAFKQAVGRSRQAVVNRMREGADAGDDHVIESAAGMMMPGSITPEDHEELVNHFKEKSKAKRWDMATQEAQNVTLQGDYDIGVSILERTDMPDYAKTAAKLNLERLNKQHTERTENEVHGKFLGEVLMQRAQGKVFVPEQIDIWVKEGKMNAVTGAQIRESLQREVGSMPGEFEKFLTEKVMSYDPAEDPTKKKWEAIQSEAVGLNLNQTQAGRFDMLMRGAMSDRSESDKSLTYVKRIARESIDGLHEQGLLGVKWKRTEAPDASPVVQAVLKDYNSLFNFGIPQEAAEKITKINGPEALRMFREASSLRTRSSDGKQVTTIDTDKYNSLPPEKKALLEKLTESDKDVDVIDDPARLTSGLRAAELQGQLDAWFDEQRKSTGAIPGEKEVNAKVNSLLKPLNQGAAYDRFFGKDGAPTAKAGGLSAPLVDRVKQLESFLPKAYDDYKQVSIGYGTRALRGETEIDETEATERLKQELAQHAARVDKYAKTNGITLSAN